MLIKGKDLIDNYLTEADVSRLINIATNGLVLNQTFLDTVARIDEYVYNMQQQVEVDVETINTNIETNKVTAIYIPLTAHLDFEETTLFQEIPISLEQVNSIIDKLINNTENNEIVIHDIYEGVEEVIGSYKPIHYQCRKNVGDTSSFYDITITISVNDIPLHIDIYKEVFEGEVDYSCKAILVDKEKSRFDNLDFVTSKLTEQVETLKSQVTSLQVPLVGIGFGTINLDSTDVQSVDFEEGAIDKVIERVIDNKQPSFLTYNKDDMMKSYYPPLYISAYESEYSGNYMGMVKCLIIYVGKQIELTFIKNIIQDEEIGEQRDYNIEVIVL